MADENALIRGRVVCPVGRLIASGDDGVPYRLLDPDGEPVDAVDVFFADLRAASRAVSTVRSYGMDLLRWFRFLWACGVPWERATREDARDFVLWLHAGGGAGGAAAEAGGPRARRGYAASTRAHCETVLRSFYDFHRDAGSGPVLNPFPLERSGHRGRRHAHRSPLDGFGPERRGRYRPKVPVRVPRRIPDEVFDRLFAALRSDRDRALLAFWVSTGARAQELLGCRERDAVPGQQVIGVVRKGTGAYQQLPASLDAFVWLRLAQEEAHRKGVPRGGDRPLWWTLRRPWRGLEYPAARAMFERANGVLGSSWTLHDLRHTAAFRMAQDLRLPLSHVQWVLGHRSLSTTQLYLTPSEGEVVAEVLAHLARRKAAPPAPVPGPGYDPAVLDVLFGRRP